MAASLRQGAVAILSEPDPAAKAVASASLAAAWREGALPIGAASPPDRPGRPDLPKLLPPRQMPKRRAFGSIAGRTALLHALAHIELNAVDLAWDMVARFAEPSLPRGFCDDWVRVAAEEALHFTLLSARLEALGAAYGDLPAHDGLWESAQATAGDLLARLAIVPLVLEARGLDVTPEMAARLSRAGDIEGAALLDRIHADEIGHVAAGLRWFEHLCAARGLEPAETFHALVRQYFKGQVKPPFNHAARGKAGFAARYYEPLAAVSAAFS